MGDGPSLSGARQRWCVRPDLQAAGSGDRDPRSTNLTTIALAEPIRGTSDRNASARLPGSRSYLRCAASAAGPDRVFPLLQSDTSAFVVGQGCTARSINPTTGSDRCCADSVGTALLLFADMIFRRDSRTMPASSPSRSGSSARSVAHDHLPFQPRLELPAARRNPPRRSPPTAHAHRASAQRRSHVAPGVHARERVSLPKTQDGPPALANSLLLSPQHF